MRSLSSRLRALGAAVALGLTLIVVPAAPASAALPPCFDFSTVGFVSTNPVAVFATHRPTITRQSNFNAPNINCTLRQGDGGAGVFILQDALRKCNGHTTLAIDAQFGTLTRNAVIWEQARRGLTVDGIYGPQTRDAILWPVYVNEVFRGSCQRH
jgi:peptidoglycan hydrolase-like protein with peptidoglycan-binding domain